MSNDDFDFLKKMKDQSLQVNNFSYSFAKEIPKGISHIGLNKINVLRDHFAYEILVRPDILEESFLSLCEQILLSSTGIVNKFGPVSDYDSHKQVQDQNNDTSVPYYSFMLESTSAGDDLSTRSWSFIRLYLGVNVDLQRVLVLQLIPFGGAVEENTVSGSGKALSSMLYSAGNMLRKSPFQEFSDTLLNNICSAMDSETMSLNHLLPSNHPVIDVATSDLLLLDMSDFSDDHHSGHITSPTTHATPENRSCYYPPPLTPLESLVDVGYVRDLQAARAQSMVLRLLEAAETMDREVRAAEAKCARLMSLLKPTYSRANVDIPSSPLAKALSSFPLALTRRAVLEPSDYDSKLILLKARRQLKQQCAESSVITLSLQDEINSLVGLVLVQLHEWCEDEYASRLMRKTAAVKDRLQVVHHFKMQLLITLHERFRTRAAGVSGVGLASNRMFVDSDQSMQTFVQEKFPFLDGQEPVLLECAGALLNGRKGTAYLTVGHVLFYSMGILLSTVMTVLPLHTVSTMTVVSASKSVFSATYQQQPHAVGSGDKETTTTTTSGLLTELTDCIVLVDAAGAETVLELRGVTPDYPRRVADLLDVLIQEKLYLLRTATDRRPSATTTASGRSNTVSLPAPPPSSSAADDLLHFITSNPPSVLPKAVDVPPVRTTTTQQSQHTVSSSVVQQAEGQGQQGVQKKVIDISVVDISSPVPAPVVVVSENSPVSPSVDSSNNSGSAKKPVARTMNLKKFLEKSHTPTTSQQSSNTPTNSSEASSIV